MFFFIKKYRESGKQYFKNIFTEKRVFYFLGKNDLKKEFPNIFSVDRRLHQKKILRFWVGFVLVDNWKKLFFLLSLFPPVRISPWRVETVAWTSEIISTSSKGVGRGKDGVSGLEGLDVVGEGKFGRDGAGGGMGWGEGGG